MAAASSGTPFGASHTASTIRFARSRERCTIEARKLRVAEDRDESERLNVRMSSGRAGRLLLVECGADRTGTNVVFPDEASRRPAACESEVATSCRETGSRAHPHGDKFVGRDRVFSSPGLVDLDGDGKKEIVAPSTACCVFDSRANTRATIKQDAYTTGASMRRPCGRFSIRRRDGHRGRRHEGTVAAYEWRNGTLAIKAGWPASTSERRTVAGEAGAWPAYLDGDGNIEGGDHHEYLGYRRAVFVFSRAQALSPRHGLGRRPRYSTRADRGDTDTNGIGQTVTVLRAQRGIATSTTMPSRKSSSPTTTTRSTLSRPTVRPFLPRPISPTVIPPTEAALRLGKSFAG